MLINPLDYIDTILVAAAGVTAWLGERAKRKNDQVKLTKDIIAMYRNALKDFEEKRKLDIEAYHKDFDSLRNELDEWKKRYLEMESKYTSLRKEFENYKRTHNGNKNNKI